MRTVRVQIERAVTIGQLVDQLADLPANMELIEIHNETRGLASDVALVFADHV